ncbi:uncharacterized protein LAJ45_02999 [Morchella importuna]|uniref:uncharacterized protein n=1 Tax=Morchella importuna TaxID=1174673 RepID=UPI001E8D5A4A|nr:uncharacterized protein LAJ45_02999 [Morchella importuna]KAH8152774.1 hypothetical protein LAJ45_02999 [Morchella importuna]
MLGLLLMRLLTPPAFDLPAVPSLTWSVTTYTPTASPHHQTFTAWDFTLPTLPLPLLLLLLALLFYALHRHEDRQRRATYEGIFLNPSVPNAKVHIATTTTAARDEGAPPKQETLDPAPGPRQWHIDDNYTRRPPSSFVAPTPLRQSQPQPHTLPQPPIHSPTQIRPVQWSYGTSYVQTYTRPAAAATRSVVPPASPLIRAPPQLPTPRPQLLLPAPQHSSLPVPMPMPMPATNIRNHALPPPVHRALIPTPRSPYSHPTHATPPTQPITNTARTVSTSNVNHTYRPLHPRPRPAYPPPLYRAATPSVRQLGRSAITKLPPLTIHKPRTSLYPRRDPSPIDEDDNVKEESDTDAMDIDLPTPPSTPPPPPETAVTPTAPSPGSTCRLRPRRHRALSRQRGPKKEAVRRVRGGRVVKSRDGAGRNWVRGFVAAPVRSRRGGRARGGGTGCRRRAGRGGDK